MQVKEYLARQHLPYTLQLLLRTHLVVLLAASGHVQEHLARQDLPSPHRTATAHSPGCSACCLTASGHVQVEEYLARQDLPYFLQLQLHAHIVCVRLLASMQAMCRLRYLTRQDLPCTV